MQADVNVVFDILKQKVGHLEGQNAVLTAQVMAYEKHVAELQSEVHDLQQQLNSEGENT